jgi:hypothetical protein
MKETKYGIIYAPTVNVGDDIQTLAGINFLKSKGIHKYEFVNRESLNDYDGDEINLVMNGWFMYDFDKFPPSKKIKPIWISFHVWFGELITKHKEYFKTQPPIGCRDQATVELFKQHGIDAYFTGCLTLAFDKHTEKGDKKYLVDINTECNYIPDFDMDMKQFGDFKIVEHDTFKKGYSDIEKRMQLANEFIDNYKKASLVVTSRLHCALPCRAFGTDCIFMHKGYESDPRFRGLEGVLNGATEYHKNTSPSEGELEKIQKFFKSYEI